MWIKFKHIAIREQHSVAHHCTAYIVFRMNEWMLRCRGDLYSWNIKMLGSLVLIFAVFAVYRLKNIQRAPAYGLWKWCIIAFYCIYIYIFCRLMSLVRITHYIQLLGRRIGRCLIECTRQISKLRCAWDIFKNH